MNPKIRLSTACANEAGGAPWGYDRDSQRARIVHFGIGAFHRAHQAWYADRLMARGHEHWKIIGVSLRSPEVARQLNPQNGLYTVTERSLQGVCTRIVGSVQEVLIANADQRRIIAHLAEPETSVISLTITEQGYCRTQKGGLDHALAASGSIYPLLAAGLKRRMDGGLSGLTLMSCDNLAQNGRQLEALLFEYLDRSDRLLAGWVSRECAFPCSMVDRIVPATTEEDRQTVFRESGWYDEGAVITEPFTQWVIEDRFANTRPRWEEVGVQIVKDVNPYERVKLRMLNAAHSALAYLGIEAGYDFVHEAIADSRIRRLIWLLLVAEAAPTIPSLPQSDLGTYAHSLLQRFENAALPHRLLQIAKDGSE